MAFCCFVILLLRCGFCILLTFLGHRSPWITLKGDYLKHYFNFSGVYTQPGKVLTEVFPGQDKHRRRIEKREIFVFPGFIIYSILFALHFNIKNALEPFCCFFLVSVTIYRFNCQFITKAKHLIFLFFFDQFS